MCGRNGVAFFAGSAVDGGVDLERGQSSKLFSHLAVELHLDPVHQLYNPLKKEIFLGKVQDSPDVHPALSSL